MKTITRFIVALSLILSAAGPAGACSAFGGPGNALPILAKNFDWVLGHGQLNVNQRHVAKRALAPRGERGRRWVSRYGSITFNQFGRDLPMGGMNEKGLAIEILWLNTAKFPARDDRASINEAQWIQYQLDTAATVQDMIRNAARTRLQKRFAAIHYFACDATGACAVFEPLAGRLKVYRGGDARVKVLTNSEYVPSRAFLAQHQGFGGGKSIPMGTYDSLDRFARLGALSRGMESLSTFEQKAARAFELLVSVQQDFTTVWSIVYDLRGRKFVYKNRDLPSGTVKEVRLADFDFSCRAPKLVFDLAGDDAGNLRARFTPYTYAGNQASLAKAAKLVKDATPAEIERVARFPETTKCLEN